MDKSEDELRNSVREFLEVFKRIALEKGLLVKDHLKNRESLLQAGLTSKQREAEILSLSVSNYCSGPHADEYKPGELWVFGKQIDGFEVYIKLKIAEGKGQKQAICFSFHKAERPLKYHFSI